MSVSGTEHLKDASRYPRKFGRIMADLVSALVSCGKAAIGKAKAKAATNAKATPKA